MNIKPISYLIIREVPRKMSLRLICSCGTMKREEPENGLYFNFLWDGVDLETLLFAKGNVFFEVQNLNDSNFERPKLWAYHL